MKAINPSELWKKRLGDWVLNPYVGCEHGCLHCYCPTMPGVRCLNHGHTQREWGAYLYPKHGIVEAVRDQLRNFTPDKARRTGWGDGWILVSFLTDCYTPSEAKFTLTRQCLQLILEAGHKVRLQTRSVLVERDFDLLKAHRGQVLLGTSLPHLDDALARCLEPRAAAPNRRLRMLERAASLDIPVYVALAPFMPFHDCDVLERVVAAVAPLKPKQVFCEVLNPKGDNISMMREALSAPFPKHAERMAQYTTEYWAKFTWKVLAHGLKQTKQFIPWPDTRRLWRPHLTPERADFLEKFLPPQQAKELTRISQSESPRRAKPAATWPPTQRGLTKLKHIQTMKSKTPTESVLRRKAACLGYKLTKIRENSRWYNQYGPYMIADAPTNFALQHGMTAEEVNGWLTSIDS